MPRESVLNHLRAVGVNLDRYSKACVDAFIEQMANKDYGPQQTAQAFFSFVQGWISDGA